MITTSPLFMPTFNRVLAFDLGLDDLVNSKTMWVIRPVARRRGARGHVSDLLSSAELPGVRAVRGRIIGEQHARQFQDEYALAQNAYVHLLVQFMC